METQSHIERTLTSIDRARLSLHASGERDIALAAHRMFEPAREAADELSGRLS